MTELKYGILCEQAIINRETGQISIINILNGIRIPKLPIEVNTTSLVLSWQRNLNAANADDSFDVRISLRGPGEGAKKRAANEEFKVKLLKNNTMAHTITHLKIEFTEAGENTFIVEKKIGDKWELETTVPIHVIVD